MCGCLPCAGFLWLDLSFRCLLQSSWLHFFYCCSLILMGSAATGIPIGAPIAASPFEILAYFCVGSYEDDARDADGHGEILGKLQVRFELLLPLLFLFFVFVFFFILKTGFLCFSVTGREKKWWWWCDVGVEWMEGRVDSYRRVYMSFIKLPCPLNFFLEPFLALCNPYRSLL